MSLGSWGFCEGREDVVGFGLADDLPEVAELELNPVIVRPDDVRADRARVRVSPAESRDPFLRRLR